MSPLTFSGSIMLLRSHLYRGAVLQAYDMKRVVDLPQEYDAMQEAFLQRCHPRQVPRSDVLMTRR